MKWMLVVLVMGSTPVATDLTFNTLDDCLQAEEAMRAAYSASYKRWHEWARANPAASFFPTSRRFQEARIGVKNQGTCIPHAAVEGR